MGTFKAALIQMRSGVEPGDNIAMLEKLVAEAARQGADYAQTPEMTGAVQKDRERLMAVIGRQDEDKIVAAAGALALKHSLFLHIGSTPIALDGGRIANRAFVFAPDGEVVATYDKLHMFDVDLENGESWRESATYRAGDEACLVDLPFATVGLSICYDIRFPGLYRDLAVAGAQVLTAPAAFTRQTGEVHWNVLQRARAIENGAFVLSAAQGGRHEDGRETYGHSIIVDPWGAVVAQADHDEPCVIVGDIDPQASGAARARIPNLQNARAFSVSRVALRPQKRLTA